MGRIRMGRWHALTDALPKRDDVDTQYVHWVLEVVHRRFLGLGANPQEASDEERCAYTEFQEWSENYILNLMGDTKTGEPQREGSDPANLDGQAQPPSITMSDSTYCLLLKRIAELEEQKAADDAKKKQPACDRPVARCRPKKPDGWHLSRLPWRSLSKDIPGPGQPGGPSHPGGAAPNNDAAPTPAEGLTDDVPQTKASMP